MSYPLPVPTEFQGRRLREAHRHMLGIEPSQRLVVVASARTGFSLWQQYPLLPEQLLAALPADEYRILFAPHTDTLGPHGDITMPMARELANGLLMVENGEDWHAVGRAAVLAADAVIGDHGALTYQATAAGIPTAVAVFGTINLPAGPLRDFARIAPRFDPDGDLLTQVERLCDQGLIPGDDIGGHELYELVPVRRYRATTAWRCQVEFGTGDSVTWRRFPATVAPRGAAGHLVAEARCLDVAARDSADLMVRCHTPLPEPEARQEAAALLEDHPLAAAASVRAGEETMVVATPAGALYRVRCSPEHASVAASVWLEAGQPAEGRWHLSGPTRTGLLEVAPLA